MCRVLHVSRSGYYSCLKRFKSTTDSNHALAVAPNLLNRKFYVDKPNVCWVSDITYIWTVSDWLYLAVFIDLFSRNIVGWSMDTSISRKLIIDAFRSGAKCRKPDTGLIVHSDRGSQYASDEFKTALLEVGSIQSMNRKGNCWDNAVYGKTYKNQQEAKMDVLKYIEVFYNKKRLHSTLGNMSPRNYENKYLNLQRAA